MLLEKDTTLLSGHISSEQDPWNNLQRVESEKVIPSIII